MWFFTDFSGTIPTRGLMGIWSEGPNPGTRRSSNCIKASSAKITHKIRSIRILILLVLPIEIDLVFLSKPEGNAVVLQLTRSNYESRDN